MCYALAGFFGFLTVAAMTSWGDFSMETRVYTATGITAGAVLLFYPLVKSMWIYLLYHVRHRYEEYRAPTKFKPDK